MHLFVFGQISKHGLPLVALRSVDDSYPPQKKSFMMLKYMHDHLLDKFEWFMRCDDDVYVHTERLELFLRSINSTKKHFIGGFIISFDISINSEGLASLHFQLCLINPDVDLVIHCLLLLFYRSSWSRK